MRSMPVIRNVPCLLADARTVEQYVCSFYAHQQLIDDISGYQIQDQTKKGSLSLRGHDRSHRESALMTPG